MSKKRVIGVLALALALAGGAGAQTGCVQPSISTVPRLPSTGGAMNDTGFLPWKGSGDWSTETITGTDVQGFWTTTDRVGGGLVPYSVYTPATRDQVRYTKLLTTFANNYLLPSRGSARTIEISYAGTAYAYINTSPGNAGSAGERYGFIYAANGAQIFDKTGAPASETDPNAFAPPGTKGIIMLDKGGVALLANGARDPARLTDATQFFLLLPNTIPATGDLKLTSEVKDPYTYSGLVDDVVVYKPETVATTFCLEKTAVKGAPTGTYDFTTTERDSAAKPQQVTGVGATPARQANAYQVFGDYVDVRELTAGTYGISTLKCKSDTYVNPNGQPTAYLVRPETAVGLLTTIPGETGYTSPQGTRNFRVAIPSGTQTICSITNDGTLQGQVTTTKTFPKGRYPVTDQATITQKAAGVADVAYTTTGTGTGVGYNVSDPTLRAISPKPTYTVAAPTTTQDPITISGAPPKLSSSTVTATRSDGPYTVTSSETVTTPGNYSSSYSCVDAASTSRASGTGTSLSIATVKFGDVITCTFVNTLTATPPPTTVKVTKSGSQVVTAGTAVTYTITANNTTADPVDVDLSDQFTPVLPAAQLTSISDSGTYNATSGLVTWPRVNIPANGSVTRTLTVDLPDPVRDSTNGDSYSGPNQVTDAASLKTYLLGTDTVLTNNGPSSASVTTNHVFTKVTKTVRNVTAGSGAGNSVSAKPDDILEYCLTYTNQSAIALTSLKLSDPLVAGQTLQTAVYGGKTLSLKRGSGTAQPTDNSGTATAISTTLTNVAAGETGTLCFKTKVNK
ncbi:hypothetical protein [Deinococcus sp.]|uniref:prealbumin-like fold domain-containing protein n=1 Tax=Deinococcus sp. TaxID=47478 RepID=UPI0025BCA4FF|nr:hypothetical protein [Deinococcus sp.]